MALSGVRNSWLMLDRNSVFARLAFSARGGGRRKLRIQQLALCHIHRGADDLAHIALRGARENRVGTVKPAPFALAMAQAVFGFEHFAVTQRGDTAENRRQARQIVGVHGGAHQLRAHRRDLVGRITNHVADLAVDPDVALLLQVEHIQQMRHHAREPLHEAVLALELLRHGFPCRDVLDGGNEMHRLPIGVAQQRHRDHHPHLGSVLVPVALFQHVAGDLARQHAAYLFEVDRHVLGMRDAGHRQPGQLRQRVTRDAAQRLVGA